MAVKNTEKLDIFLQVLFVHVETQRRGRGHRFCTVCSASRSVLCTVCKKTLGQSPSLT